MSVPTPQIDGNLCEDRDLASPGCHRENNRCSINSDELKGQMKS